MKSIASKYQAKGCIYIYAHKSFVCRSLLFLTFFITGFTSVWGQSPVEITTDTDANGTIEESEKKLYLIQTNAFPSFYIAPQDKSNNNNWNITTNNILGEYMLWYFLDAGEDNGTQYYYIVNNSTGKYICHAGGASNTRTVSLVEINSSNEERCKFKLVLDESSGTTGFYNIDAKGNLAFYGLNKQSGSQANDNPIRLTNGDYIHDSNSKWKFVPYNGTFTYPTPPFTPSTDSEKHYYEIHNIQKDTYYAATDATPDKVIFTNQLNESRAWYLKEAASDTWYKYYYIINPATGGKYMYYDGTADNTGNQTKAVSVKDYDPANEARYQFVVVQTARGDGAGRVTCYAIIPKLLIDNLWTSSSIGYAQASITNGLNMGIINSRSASNGAHWEFIDTTFTAVCDHPVIAFDRTTGKASITTSTLLPSIYYTTDGTTPSSTNGTLYEGPFTLTNQITIKAIVTKEGYSNSVVTTSTIEKVATPTIQQETGTHNVSITTATPGATIYYTTDGSTPTTSSTLYTGASEELGGKPIKAIAVKDNMINSDIGEGEIDIKCATPVVSFDNATSMVTITCGTAGSTIHYTIDNNEPTTTSTAYTAPFSVTSPTTVKAIATHATLDPSAVAELVIPQVATPTIQNNGSNAVSITTTTVGATIYYTTDGTTPTTSSAVYSEPLTENISGVTIKAIAVKEGMVTSVVGSNAVTLQCATPDIKRSGQDGFTFSCSFPPSGVTIYYTTDGTTPTTSSSSISPGDIVSCTLPITVKAMAVATNYENSEVATANLKEGMDGEGTVDNPYTINFQPDVADFIEHANTPEGASSHYKVIATEPLDFSGTDPITQAFVGTFDGGTQPLTGLTHPLFNTVDGGVVKNVTLKNVAISSSSEYVGAIAGVAQGYSRIYNCGILPNDNTFPEGTHPTVAGGTCAGGIVGKLDGDSRVINCYSYADVSASTTAAGIVGENTFASTAEVSGGKYTKLKTAVVNCMFYGNITGGTNQYGVYGGTLITNAAATGISSYNYYRSGSTFTTTSGEPTAYNCSFPADERYLTQVEFHRSLLNSNRELCGWWVGSDVAPSTLTTTEVQAIAKDASLMYKWVVDPNLAPYPILKPFGKYPSIINTNTGTPWFDRTTANPFEGQQLGTLSVIIKSGSSASDQHLFIPITDMDSLHYDFGYRKIQLPYYNTVFGNPDGATWEEKYAGNYTDQVVTGWKITNVSGGNNGSFVADWQYGYNFADRNCTQKDLYSVSGRVFAQGGYYYVPDNVSEITIEAYWGKAIYVRNNGGYYDRVNITKASTGSQFAPAGTRDNNVNGATIQTTSIRGTLTNANIDAKKTVYDYALVLVGNVQESVGKNDVVHATQDTRGFTIMSVDLDFDEEPDYCLEWQLGDNMTRQVIAPIRFDFLPVVELGVAGKLDNSTNFFSLGCYRSKGHFEVTETAFIRFGQFEFELGTRDDGPVILNGGIYDQYCRGRNGETNQHINYVILGGHIVMPSFTPGAHVNGSATYQTRHCAVNVLGGDFTSFYLTGGYNEGVKPYEDNPHCYIDGGRFGTIAAAYKEGIAGDVTWRINHALIGEFYGGGVMAQATGDTYKIVKGSIDVVLDNSIVGKYCGGPKFGDMVAGKTVTTSASNTVFTQFFGAGNGGTNYMQYKNTDATGTPAEGNWTATVNSNYHPGQYRNRDQGYEADYDIEVINTSTGDVSGKVVNRSYYYSAQFATTNTGNVTNTLNNCTVKTNFYGGGFLGGVTGNVTSTLNNCTVTGSVFGAGYSASAGTVTISNKDKVPPVPNTYTGMIKPQSGGTSTTYYWTHDRGTTGNPITTGDDGAKYFYTEVPLDNLGSVSGNVTLTIKGTTTVGQSVYGGGEESAVGGDTEVNIQNGTISTDVFGGGKEGDIHGSVLVNMQGGTVTGSLYGGGALANTNINNVTEGYGTNTETIPSTSTNTTTVNLLGGTIHGDAYGGGLGQLGNDPVAALVYGDVNVNLGSSGGSSATAFMSSYYTGDHANVVKSGRIFGCNNLNGSPKGDVTVTVYKTVPGNVTRTSSDKLKLKETEEGYVAPTYELNTVYGGGNLADFTTPVAGKKAKVIIETCDVSIRDVYGGGNAAAVPETDVLIKGAYEIQEVFGGGNGMDDYTTDGGTTWVDNPGANINGNANTLLTGGYIHEAYGGSNDKGTISGTVSIDVGDGDGAPAHCDLDVKKIVGAGKNADIEGDLVMVLGCKPDVFIPQLFGGADNANVHGNVELTITSGKFGQVFGGNNQGGAILGHITLNIEETGDCDVPIEIDELYLGGNEAAYSVYGYYDSGETLSNGKPKYLPRTAEMHAITVPTAEGYKAPVTNPAEDATHTVPYTQPELNIISCTYIGKVFGGGLGTGAAMYANPTVNINMVKGHYADNTSIGVPAKMTALGLNSLDNPDNLGVLVDVYGGGNEAAVYGNTTVNIGTMVGQPITLTSTGDTPNVVGAFVSGTVYGAGKGKATEPSYAIVTGNTQVNMAGGKVCRSIYGGGELSSVGTFTETYAETSGTATDANYHVKGEPKTCAENTGKTEVIISGGQVGLVHQLMPDISNPNYHTSDDDYGYVFCAGKGMADPTETNSDGVPYANLLAVSGSSHLEISGGLIAASVYGGSENGQVLGDTHVEIKGGQIGSGHYKEGSTDYWDDPYTETQWTTAINAIKSGVVADINAAAADFHECDAWPFGAEGNRHVYDFFADDYDSKGGASPGSDGHSYYGHVFGGGSGYYPYAAGQWRRTAGRVNGNTLVEITGGHILTNVYGGNEITDVLGHSKVKMTGGTVGVPRTVAGIQARPVNSYIFGAGMGDPRVLFNGWSNVASSEVIVDSVAVVFGSVFGGGEDGHVLGNSSTTIKGDALIGTFGTSGVDGNIFGSGRGFSAIALTAGAVCGNVDVNIAENAKILGSIFGGGRLAAVGTYLAAEGTDNYGKLIPEGEDPYGTGSTTHGNVTINISGGTIGTQASVNSTHDFSVGDVFGGSKGTLMNDWAKSQKLGLVKNTTVNISQAEGSTTTIYGNVYGGGEIASVGSYIYADNTAVSSYNTTHTTEPLTVGDVYRLDEANTGNATINITGGTVGHSDPSDAHGHVFGGCLGRAGTDYSGYSFVNHSVVTLENGTVYGSIFGGGENGHVLDDTNVNIKGGSVGIQLDNLTGTIPETTIYRGNVYGGGRGIDTYNNNGTQSYSITAGKVSGHTTVSITGGQIYRNVYGGGSLASVGDPDENSGGQASVSITGGKIGTDGGYHNGNFVHLLENGHVFGSGRGVAGGSNDDFIRLAYVKNTQVTIGGTAYVTGSVFGSGENGHVRKNTTVTVNAGTGYSHEQAPTGEDIEPYPIIGYPLTQAEMVESPTNPVMIYRGNVYGGGRGIDHTTTGHLSETAGAVKGNTTVNINGGTIRHNVYGGGSLASTGDLTDNNGVITYHDDTGLATINISGGLIGMSPLLNICKNGADTYSGLNNGQVYGGARGVAAGQGQTAGSVESEYVLMAYVHDTQVNVNDGAHIFGSVFGGGANGHVSRNTVVNVSGGEIGTNPSFIGDASNYYYMDPATGIDGHVIYTGNVYGGGRGIDRNEEGQLSATAGRVYGNTKVNVTGGQIYHNVYGGGSLASVGTFTKSGETYTWTENTGKSEVIISGGMVGFEDFSMDDYMAYMGSNPGTDPSTVFGKFTKFKFNNGRVFGSGRGMAGQEYNEYAYVRDAYVTIQGTGAVKGNVFGSGENGHVKRNTYVEIKGGEIGYKVPSLFLGNVYGGGRGVDLYNGAVSVSAGRTEGNTNVTVSGGKIYRDVYGGGSLASVGQADDSSKGLATVTIESGAVVGDDFCVANGFGGNVFGSGRGMVKLATGPDYSQMAYVNRTEVIVKGHVMGNVYGGGNAGHVRNNTHVQILDGSLVGTNYGGNVYYGNVFGAGKGTSKSNDYSATAGAVLGSVVVDMLGGTVLNDVYGGAALANSNIGNATDYGTASEAIPSTSTNTTTVNLVGGTITNAYGGGQGDDATAAIVYGDASVLLNGSSAEGATNNCVVKGNIFGCNNINGTPKGHALVHVYRTQGWTDDKGTPDTSDDVSHTRSATKDDTTYEVAAVYGGGNMAAYVPVSNSEYTEVIIDGCDLTSIDYVYGGGNAASVSAAKVLINGTYELGSVFGGGNGKDALPNGDPNPGANVGLMAYPNAANAAYSTKEERATNYGYGTGKTHVMVYGGTVHEVYGGSNTKGNIRVEARAKLEDEGVCDFDLGEAYGGGRNAEMDGDAVLEIGCIRGLGKAYGGAAEADVNGNVVLNITNGTYGQVFGGNDRGGNISGSITVNIEETGCNPIIIGELYGGGNLAAYTAPTGINSPVVNVKSFTSIGTVFGGGYGAAAKITGNPEVNIDVVKGIHMGTVIDENSRVIGSTVKKSGDEGYSTTEGFEIPSHAANTIGAIGTVYGGGNAAPVIGNTNINIGTLEYIPVTVAVGSSVTGCYTRSGNGTESSPYTYPEASGTAAPGTTYYKKVVGVDIREDVFGAGLGKTATVSGNTNVVIGR